MPSMKIVYTTALLASLVSAIPAPAVSQISDGQPQAPTAAAASSVAALSQISDHQPQAPTAAPASSVAAVSQISDHQPQAPTAAPASSAAAVSQISDHQPQAPTAAPASSAAAVSQISDHQPQAPTVAPASYAATITQASQYVTAAAAAGLATTFGPDSQVAATQVVSQSAYPIVSSQVTGATSHGSYTGVPLTTGAPQLGPAAASVGTLPLNPTATYYNVLGGLTQEEPAPYTPAGGLGTNGSLPRYMVESDFDFESIALGLYQEWIELDLFHNGLAVFSEQDFIDAGLTAEDRSYIEFMADQESGHSTLLTNMLGQAAPPQCTYDYSYTSVREFVDFCQRLTRWGESGVWGYINHLDSREVAQLLAQSIATEARQQMSFRQMSGLVPMDVWFESGIPQSWSWSLLAPYISSCPAGTTRLAWQNFPVLHIVNNANINRFSPNDTGDYEVTGRRAGDPSISTIPADESCEHLNVTGYGCGPAISHNKSEPLSFPGKKILFEWDAPGQVVGPNNSYVTASQAGIPAYVGWVSQLNLTYSDLVLTGSNTGYTFQPEADVYAGDPIINGTMFVVLTDTDAPFTPFNLTMLNPHVVALGLYQAG